MATEVIIETPTVSTDAKEQTAEVVIDGMEPGKQKDKAIEIVPREPGKEKVSVNLENPEDPKTN